MTLQHRVESPEIDRVLAQELGNSNAVLWTADFQSGRNDVLGSERSDFDCRCAATDFNVNCNCLGKALCVKIARHGKELHRPPFDDDPLSLKFRIASIAKISEYGFQDDETGTRPVL